MDKSTKNILTGIVVVALIAAAAYYFAGNGSIPQEDFMEFAVEEEDGLVYLVDKGTDGRVSDGFHSFRQLDNDRIVGILGDSEFAIVIEDGQAKTVSPGFDRIEATENGFLGVKNGVEVEITLDGQIDAQTAGQLDLDDYEETLADLLDEDSSDEIEVESMDDGEELDAAVEGEGNLEGTTQVE